jgi:hypothetical protein
MLLVNTRCNGDDKNDVMGGNDDNDFLYGFDGVPNNDNLDGGKILTFARVNQTLKSTVSAAEQLKT